MIEMTWSGWVFSACVRLNAITRGSRWVTNLCAACQMCFHKHVHETDHAKFSHKWVAFIIATGGLLARQRVNFLEVGRVWWWHHCYAALLSFRLTFIITFCIHTSSINIVILFSLGLIWVLLVSSRQVSTFLKTGTGTEQLFLAKYTQCSGMIVKPLDNVYSLLSKLDED